MTRRLSFLFVASLVSTGTAQAPTAASTADPLPSLPLTTLSAFRPTSANWRIAGAATADRSRPLALTDDPGTGVLVNTPAPGARGNLFTTWEHGDLDLSLDIMMPKGSNSGLYFMGRYEVQLLDSWGVRAPTFADLGGIYQRWDDGRGAGREGFEGTAPRQNASRAPGLWQHLEISFRAPTFKETQKLTNARFATVRLNGVVVQENVEVTGPTRAAAFNDEVPTGPLMIQGDHGPIAIRNIRYQARSGVVATDSARSPQVAPAPTRPPPGPILVEPRLEPLVIRSFIRHRGATRVTAVSVADPAGAHFSYDLAQGALLYLWRGPFIETTQMWHSRGDSQTAEPLGSTITLPGTPALAFLADGNAAWPDSVDERQFQRDGYELDPAGRPTFLYQVRGVAVEDAIRSGADGLSLRRELHLRSAAGAPGPEGLYLQVAEDSRVIRQSDGTYVVGDGGYYLTLPAGGTEPVIRRKNGRQELLLPVLFEHGEAQVSYTIVW